MGEEKKQVTWFDRYRQHPAGILALGIVVLFALMGVYAPFLASSKPLFVIYDHQVYFPLFRYLFFRGFYTTYLDLFFNVFMFLLPLMIASFYLLKKKRWMVIGFLLAVQVALFFYVAFTPSRDPASDPTLTNERIQALGKLGDQLPTWDFELQFMSPYAKLNRLLRYKQLKNQNERLQPFQDAFATLEEKRWRKREDSDESAEVPENELLLPTLWQRRLDNLAKQRERLTRQIESGDKQAQERLNYLNQREAWLESESAKITLTVMPLIRPFHWEEDAGGEQALNAIVPFYELTRVGRKDLTAALIFGVRISLVVGLAAVSLALLIGIPVGALAGYYGGKWDILVCRLMEIWESMPTFFMLLLFVAVTQSKSIFMVIMVIGLFGWMGASRFIRGEFFKQRSLPYIEACRAMGFNDTRIIFRHILPNAIPPLLTLLPFSIMGAITAEAGLSFLGLGEAGSCSWGVLMDEGRRAFPGESYLLWPPAIMLTILLIAIALMGDALRDAFDPKMRK